MLMHKSYILWGIEMVRALAISAVLFCIAGIVGLIFTFKNFAWGTGGSIQGVTTFATFLVVGLVTIISLAAASGED